MKQDNTLVNRVVNSGIITIDLSDFLPQNNMLEFDISPYLFQGIVLKEKDFRKSLTKIDYSKYKDKLVAVYCKTDALIPMWAYMLIAAKLKGITEGVYFGNIEEAEHQYILERINLINPEIYEKARVVVKGCGDKAIPETAFLAISQKLLPSVKSLMYGEPCSMVPIYINKKNVKP